MHSSVDSDLNSPDCVAAAVAAQFNFWVEAQWTGLDRLVVPDLKIDVCVAAAG